MIRDAFSPIMIDGALVLPEVSVGMIDASATRRLSMPHTRNWSSTTAIGSEPILQVARVICGFGIVPDPIEQFVVALGGDTRRHFIGGDVPHRRGRHDTSGDAHRL